MLFPSVMEPSWGMILSVEFNVAAFVAEVVVAYDDGNIFVATFDVDDDDDNVNGDGIVVVAVSVVVVVGGGLRRVGIGVGLLSPDDSSVLSVSVGELKDRR